MTVGGTLGLVLAGALPSVGFTLGVAVGTAFAILYVQLLVTRLQAPWARIGVREAGSWLAAVVLMLLGLQLR
jgi:hypothetical protein